MRWVLRGGSGWPPLENCEIAFEIRSELLFYWLMYMLLCSVFNVFKKVVNPKAELRYFYYYFILPPVPT